MTAFAETPQQNIEFTVHRLPALREPEDYTQLWYGQIGDIIDELPQRLGRIGQSLEQLRSTYPSWADDIRRDALGDWTHVQRYADAAGQVYGTEALGNLTIANGRLSTSYNKKHIQGDEVVSPSVVSEGLFTYAQERRLDLTRTHAKCSIGSIILTRAVESLTADLPRLAQARIEDMLQAQAAARQDPKAQSILQDLALKKTLEVRNSRMVQSIGHLYGHLDRIREGSGPISGQYDEAALGLVVNAMEGIRDNQSGTLEFRAAAEQYFGYAPEQRQIEVIKAILSKPGGLDKARQDAIESAARPYLR